MPRPIKLGCDQSSVPAQDGVWFGGVALLREAGAVEKLDLTGEERVGVGVLTRECEEPLR